MPVYYTLTTREDVINRFVYHPPKSDEAIEMHANVRWALKDVAIFLLDTLPESRETSLAIKSLEEAMFWANAAIARNQSKQEDAITVETRPNPTTTPAAVPEHILQRLLP